MRVLTVVGNRPQFIKAAAVSARLRERAEEVLVHTGQHYDRELSQVFFDELDVPAPDLDLGVGSGTHAEQTAALLRALEPVVVEREPDGVLIYGDTNSTLAGALVAAKLGVPLAHVEAGMRAFDRSIPEEVNRVVADHLSGLLLCSTDTAVENLRREGISEDVHQVGDVMVDIALALGPVSKQRSDVLDRLGLEPGSYLVATAHRAGTVDDPHNLGRLVELLAAAARSAPVVFPVHPRTMDRLRSGGRLDSLVDRGVRVIEPLGYIDFTRLMRGARAVLTDSGGLQKEAYLAGVPCLTMRDSTEWNETVAAGWNRLVGLDVAAAIEGLEDLEASRRELPPPDPGLYGGGRAGERVAQAVTEWLS